MILMFGGFSSPTFLDDVYCFKHEEKSFEKLVNNLPFPLFAYQMPSMFEPATNTLLTVDAQTKRALYFTVENHWQLL